MAKSQNGIRNGHRFRYIFNDETDFLITFAKNAHKHLISMMKKQTFDQHISNH